MAAPIARIATIATRAKTAKTIIVDDTSVLPPTIRGACSIEAVLQQPGRPQAKLYRDDEK